MPQIQILPAVPSFGEKLGDTLGNALGQLGSAYIQKRSAQKGKESDKRILEEFSKIERPGFKEVVEAFSKLTPRGQSTLSPLFSIAGKESAKQSLNPSLAPGLLKDLLAKQGINLGGEAPQTSFKAASPQPSFNPNMQASAASQEGQDQPTGEVIPPEEEAAVAQQQRAALPNGAFPSPTKGGVLEQLPNEALVALSGFKGRPGDDGVIGNMAETALQQRMGNQKLEAVRSNALLKQNEPLLHKSSETLQNLRTQDARFERLEKLFKEEDKFPSSFTTALFSQNGQLTDLAASQLSREAQEAVKLIIDSTSDIKDTYGAKVTNFDLQTYFKKLPSLLNSAKGRQSVLRDLRIINKMDKIHEKGIQKIFQEQGGSDKIPYSKAEYLFEKKYGPELKKLKKEFINPSVKSFKGTPDASVYKGSKIVDKRTGEVLISDGTAWVPYKEEK